MTSCPTSEETSTGKPKTTPEGCPERNPFGFSSNVPIILMRRKEKRNASKRLSG